MTSKILIIDDDTSLTELLETYLSQQGYSIRIANDGAEGLRSFLNHQPDLVVLDVVIPKMDGWKVMERIRDFGRVPIVMLTSRSDEQDILKGFSSGADDYVSKPFSFAELAARIQAVLARNKQESENTPVNIDVGDLAINFRSSLVRRGKTLISLTPTEFKLLKALVRKIDETVSPEELVREVWGPQYAGEVGHVRRYIWHLRNKIEVDPKNPRYVQNVHGFGYKFLSQN